MPSSDLCPHCGGSGWRPCFYCPTEEERLEMDPKDIPPCACTNGLERCIPCEGFGAYLSEEDEDNGE